VSPTIYDQRVWGGEGWGGEGEGVGLGMAGGFGLY
jgi:hypothetical protein